DSNLASLSTSTSTGISSLSTGLSTTNDNLVSLSTSTSTGISSLSTGLSTVGSNLANAGQSTADALGGGASYDPNTGAVSAPTYTTTNADGSISTAHNVGDALTNLYNGGTKYFHANSTEPDSVASGTNAIAVGPSAVASGASAVAMGHGAQATGTNAIAIGTGALATGSQAIGANARAGGGGVAIGDGADAGGTPLSAAPGVSQGTAVGFGSVVNQSGGVALGAGSVVNTPAGVAGYVPAGASAAQASAIAATTSTQAAVSVGNAANGQYRQITGVAAGSADSDAVNVSQLKATNSVVNQLSTQSAYQNYQIGALNNRLGEVERIAYSGTAMAFAMAGTYLPTLYPGEKAVGIGLGAYKGYGAVGLTFKALSNDGTMSWGAGVSTTGKDWGVNAGIGWKWK
ncbi:YadA family autotransporter adhesin, partial [Xenophilus azovorans]|uniref:YadA family autotransporter adhesin n=1 Tax=Xenophilus azovorans TaxID=151755 RepID=UPI000690E01F